MDFETALQLVNEAMSAQFGRLVNDVELALFKGAWQGQTYEEIAAESSYAASYLTRVVGPKFWKSLSQSLGEKVTKTSFRAALEQRYARSVKTQAGQTSVAGNFPTSAQEPAARADVHQSLYIDWGAAPDVSTFYGRQTDLDRLNQWVMKDHCRLVAVLGSGGIGKTALSAKFVERLTTQAHCRFTHIIWRSLRNAPAIEMLLQELVAFLSHQQKPEPTPRCLLHCLRKTPCLVVLDNAD